MNADGLLNMNGFFDDFGTLTVNGGTVALHSTGNGGLGLFNSDALTMNGGTITGPGRLRLGGGNIVASGGAVITADVDLNGTPTTFIVADGVAPADLLITGGIVNTSNSVASLTKSGAGLMRLTGISTYTGPTTINAGNLQIIGRIAPRPS